MHAVSGSEFETLMQIAEAVNVFTESKDLSSLAISSFRKLDRCVVDKKKRTITPLKDNLAYLQKIVERASIPPELEGAKKTETLQKLALFSERLHKIIDHDLPTCALDHAKAIDAGIARLRRDPIDLIWYLTQAAKLAQVVIPLSIILKRLI